MPDNKLSFQIEADASSVATETQKVIQYFNRLGSSVDRGTNVARIAISKAVKEIEDFGGKAAMTGSYLEEVMGSVAKAIGSVKTGAVSLDNVKLDSLLSELLKQTELVEELAEAYDEATQKQAYWAIYANGGTSRVVEEFENATAEVDALAQAFDTANTKQKELAQNLVETSMAEAQKYNAAEVKAASAEVSAASAEMARQMRQDNAETRSSFDLLAFGIQNTSRVLGVNAGEVTGYVQSIRNMKKAYTQTAQAAGTWVASLTMGASTLMLAANLIASVVSKISEAKAELRQAQQEAASSYSLADADLSSAQRYIGILEDQTATTEQVRDAKQALANLFPTMIRGYTEEGEAILASNPALKAHVELLEKQVALETAAAANAAPDLVKDWENNVAEAERYLKILELIPAAEQGNVDALKELGQLRAAGYSDYSYNFDTTKKDAQSQLSRLQTEISAGLDDVTNAVTADIHEKFGPETATALADAIQAIAASGMAAAEGEGDFSVKLSNILLNVDAAATAIAEKESVLGEALSTGVKNIIFSALGNLDIEDIDFNQLIADAIKIDGEVISAGLTEGGQDLRHELISALLGSGEELTEEDTALINDILTALMENADLEGMEAEFDRLGEIIRNGGGDEQTIQQYHALGQAIRNIYGGAVEDATGKTGQSAEAIKKLKPVLDDTGKGFTRAANDATKAGREFWEAGGKGEELAQVLKDVNNAGNETKNAFKDVAQLKHWRQAITDAGESAEYTAGKNDALNEAIEGLADAYNIAPEQVMGMLPALDDYIGRTEDAAWTTYDLEMAFLAAALASVNLEIQTGKATEEHYALAQAIHGSIDALEAFKASASNDPSGIIPRNFNTGGGSKKKGGGGGGSSSKSDKNSAYDEQLKQLERLKALNQLTVQEEYAWLQKILNQYAKTADEKAEIRQKLYDLEVQMSENELNHLKAMDQLTLEEEISLLERRKALYKEGTDARKALEEELYQKQKELERQKYDNDVYYGKLSLEQQEAYIKQQIKQYKVGTDARIELEKELYDIQQQIREKQISQIDSMTDALVTALENRYEGLRAAEEEAIRASIESLEDWRKTQIEALQAQIKALEDVQKEEDKAEEERKRRREIAALEQELLYEKDAYNQLKLQEQIAQKKLDLDEWLLKQEREAQKASLQEQIDAVTEYADAEKEALEEQIDATNKAYEEMTKQASLEAQALAMLQKSTQNEILAMLKTYASDYNLSGQSLGEQFVDGMSKAMDVSGLFDSLVSQMNSYQSKLASTATSAADTFLANKESGTVGTSYSIEMHFNAPGTDAIEVRNELERILEQARNL